MLFIMALGTYNGSDGTGVDGSFRVGTGEGALRVRPSDMILAEGVPPAPLKSTEELIPAITTRVRELCNAD